MAYYAKISNDEFTVSERARLMEARDEKGAIEANNMASAEYEALKTAYYDSFNSATLQTLEGELAALQSQYTYDMTEEEEEALNNSMTAKQAEIDAEKAALVPGQETALSNLNAKKAEGTEALTAEIEALNTAIANALCRVTAMYSGVDEIVMVPGDSSAIDAEIKALEESKRNIDWGDSRNPPAEIATIDQQIQAKLDEKNNIPQVEFDNTVYWEGYYGGCKRTSYNTRGGVHQLGGTPFRKNYAGVGYIYDPVRDAFYGQQPYASWILNEDTCSWAAPVAKPEGMDWYWKEDTTEWVDYYWQPPTSEQPFPSWTYDGVKWTAPEIYPQDREIKPMLAWDEENQQWI